MLTRSLAQANRNHEDQKSQEKISIPTDVIVVVLFELLPTDAVVKLRLVSPFFKNLVDMTYWQTHHFRLSVYADRTFSPRPIAWVTRPAKRDMWDLPSRGPCNGSRLLFIPPQIVA